MWIWKRVGDQECRGLHMSNQRRLFKLNPLDLTVEAEVVTYGPLTNLINCKDAPESSGTSIINMLRITRISQP